MTPNEIIRRAGTLKAARQTTATHWQEVSEFIMPSREFTTTSSPGSRARQRRIYNTMPVMAAQQLAGGLHGMLTSPALRWFRLNTAGRTPGEDDAFSDDASQWFETATERVYEVFNSPKAGFNTAAHELYLDLVAFGCGCMFIGDAGRNGPVYHSVPLSEVFIATTRMGKVDTLFRSFKLTARQVVQEWPDVASRKVRDAAEKQPDLVFEVVHAVYPDESTKRAHDFASCYVLCDGEEELESGGFLDFPYVFPRWSRRSGEDYGFGPGMLALPDIRMLNKMEEINLKGMAKVVDPPLVVPDDGFLSPVQTQPGGFNYYRSGENMKDRMFPLPTGARPDLALEYVQAIEGRIREMFYVTWMNLPTRPNMTATEVLQRRDEQMRLLGPMVARAQQEFLGPLIERTFAIMWRNGMFPPAPAAMSGMRWEVEYQSPLALAQKSSDADAVVRWMQTVAMAAQVSQDAVDVADMPKVIRFVADRYGVPGSVVRSAAEAQEIADGRAQMQQGAAQVAGLQGVAKAAKDGAGAVQALAQMAPEQMAQA